VLLEQSLRVARAAPDGRLDAFVAVSLHHPSPDTALTVAVTKF